MSVPQGARELEPIKDGGKLVQRELAYIVMPPGHGKSYNHLSVPGLIEADTVYNCKGDSELQLLRKTAKSSAEWDEYDTQWAQRLLNAIPGGRWVVMVPSQDVGEKLGAVCLGNARLCREVWAENLESRGKIPEDYNWGTARDEDCTMFTSNNDLQMWLRAITDAWRSMQQEADRE